MAFSVTTDLIRSELLTSAAAVHTQTTTRHLPIEKGRALRRIPDASVRYIPFSEHIKRDFADAASAQLFHDETDSEVVTAESPTEILQTVAASEPAMNKCRSGFRLDGTLYKVGYIVSSGTQRAETLPATLVSLEIADDGDSTVSQAEYATYAALRVGDFVATC